MTVTLMVTYESNGIVYSSDYGATWSYSDAPAFPVASFNSVAMSNNGRYQFSGGSNAVFYRSIVAGNDEDDYEGNEGEIFAVNSASGDGFYISSDIFAVLIFLAVLLFVLLVCFFAGFFTAVRLRIFDKSTIRHHTLPQQHGSDENNRL